MTTAKTFSLDLATFVGRNQHYSKEHDGSLGPRPRAMTAIVACADARTDPAHFLGLEPGDSIVFRTLGGRVTAGVEDELAILCALAHRLAPGGPPVHVVLVHHTNCGMQLLAGEGIAEAMSRSTRVGVDQLRARAIRAPGTSIEEDVERLRRSLLVPRGLLVSGHVLDLDSGVMREVVAPRVI